MSAELKDAIDAVVDECLAVADGEEVLTICNPATVEIGRGLRDRAARSGAESVLALIDERASHAAEPPPPVAAAMMAADVIFAPTVQSLSHTAARRAASEAGARIASLPGVTSEMLARVMSADMESLRRLGGNLAVLLTESDSAQITCGRGSHLHLPLGDRKAIPDAGDLRRAGAFGNLPCGEGFIAPVEGGACGTLIIDGSIAGVGRVDVPVELRIEDGHLVFASGREGENLMELLTAHGKDGTNVAELGIGTNEKAILTGNILEDEKIKGTCHVAFGASAAIGGSVQVPVHLDCVAMRPTVEVGGQVVTRDGELLLD